MAGLLDERVFYFMDNIIRKQVFGNMKEIVIVIDSWITDTDYWSIECTGNNIKHYRLITSLVNEFDYQRFFAENNIKVLRTIKI